MPASSFHRGRLLGIGYPKELGRGDRIRTYDPLLPKQLRYQAALRPDMFWLVKDQSRFLPGTVPIGTSLLVMGSR